MISFLTFPQQLIIYLMFQFGHRDLTIRDDFPHSLLRCAVVISDEKLHSLEHCTQKIIDEDNNSIVEPYNHEDLDIIKDFVYTCFSIT